MVVYSESEIARKYARRRILFRDFGTQMRILQHWGVQRLLEQERQTQYALKVMDERKRKREILFQKFNPIT